MYCACSNNPHLGDRRTETEREHSDVKLTVPCTHTHTYYTSTYVYESKRTPLITFVCLSVECTHTHTYTWTHKGANNHLNHLHQLNDDIVKNGLCGGQI